MSNELARIQRSSLTAVLFTCWMVIAGGFVIVSIYGRAAPERIVAVALAVVSFTAGYRTNRMATIVIDEEAVHIREYRRTKHVPWSAVTSVYLKPITTARSGPGYVPAIKLTSGGEVVAREFFTRRSATKSTPSNATAVVATLNAAHDEHRPHCAPNDLTG